MSILYARLFARLNPRVVELLQARLRRFARLALPVGTLLAVALSEAAGRRWMP